MSFAFPVLYAPGVLPTAIALLAGAFFFGDYLLYSRPPSSFPLNVVVTIPVGTTVRGAATLLADKNIIASENVFVLLVSLFSGDGVKAGSYAFERPARLATVARRLAEGAFRMAFIPATFPEGITIAEAARLCGKTLPNCREAEFTTLAQGREGFLFPDTYHFEAGARAADVIALMRQNFGDKIALLSQDIARFGKPVKDIVNMASLIEAEAKTPETRRLVSGILWKRISLRMPLQVDAAFRYINGKDSYSLVTEDLLIDSPYNTYLYAGLPKGPIGNPGFDALQAALHPTVSPYLYYLTDRAGNFYFAKTHEEHLLNKERYLD